MYPVSSGTATVDSRAKLSGRAASRGDRTPWALLGVSPSARLRDARAAFSRGPGPAEACRPRSPGAPWFPLVRGCPPTWKRSARAKRSRAEAGPLGALSAPPGKRGARVSGGSSPLPFPQSPSLRGCLPAPSPPAAEASIPSARGPGAADVFKAHYRHRYYFLPNEQRSRGCNTYCTASP